MDYEAPGRSCTTMAYSADGTRYTTFSVAHRIHFACLNINFLFFGLYVFHELYLFFGQMVGCSPVVPARMVSHTLWSGMRVKGL